ncbi:LamG-like jellyroll fold domain-containing protein [Clavibacter sp. MX14-G9D]|uniref:LamG-like jellyroll fold domain-containing protein n=1 Tax=Clavibacter sp. MX14-G9D TaxID=3064656 RepID=UPI00293F22A7|nr:LamG-like jellyroll fold domain-containing protein [Clavibacter sp. MX14-G9D]
MRRARRPPADPEARHRRRPLVAAGIALAALCGVLLLVPGTTGAYVAKVTGDANSASSASFFSCAAVQAGERTGALFSWSLTQPSGSTTAPDTDSGAYPGTYRNGMTSTTTAPQACPRGAGGSYALADNALAPSYVTSPLQQSNPTTFSLELWFRTTVKGGRVIGFGDSPSGLSLLFDRHVYITTAGRLVFVTFGSNAFQTLQTLQTPGVVTDGAWHHVVATMSPTAGSALYLDGAQVAANPQSRTA